MSITLKVPINEQTLRKDVDQLIFTDMDSGTDICHALTFANYETDIGWSLIYELFAAVQARNMLSALYTDIPATVVGVDIKSTPSTATIEFESPDDAMMFKLTHGC